LLPYKPGFELVIFKIRSSSSECLLACGVPEALAFAGVVLAVGLVLFASVNWVPVTVTLWGGLQADVKLPVLVLVAFLIGFLPMFVLHRTRMWSIRRRAETQERLHGILSDLVFETPSLEGMPDAEFHMRAIRRVAGQYIEGMSPTVVGIAVGTALGDLRPGHRKPLIRVVFNISQRALAFAIAGLILSLAGAGPPLSRQAPLGC
jgi:uncharacterized integral membrane protein